MGAADMLWEIDADLFYLHHLLCNLSCLVNIQDNLGIPHHRVKCPAFTQADRGGVKIRGHKTGLQWFMRSAFFEEQYTEVEAMMC